MIRRKSEGIFFVEKFVDQIIVYITWICAYWFRFHFMESDETYLFSWYAQYGLLLVISSAYFFRSQKLYTSEHLESLQKQIVTQLRANFISVLIFVVLAFFLSQHRVSRIVFITYFMLSTVVLVLNKIVFRKFFLQRETNAVVLGESEQALTYIEKVKNIPNFNIKGRTEEDIDADTDLIVIGYGNEDYTKSEEALKKYNEEIIPVILLPNIKASVLGYDIQYFRGVPMVLYNEPSYKSLSLFLKRVMDVTACSLGLLLLSPFLFIIAMIIKLTSKGPIFYSQVRVGVDGREFNIWKFRSMKTGEVNHQGWTVKDDPRVTRIGKFIRKTSIDELPQLWNVIIGDMSLVGPRPERPKYVNQFKKDIPAYMLRHKMKAGITGWAQVNGWRGDTSIPKRIECDLWYIKNWSIWLDISIIFMTFWKMFNKNAY